MKTIFPTYDAAKKQAKRMGKRFGKVVTYVTPKANSWEWVVSPDRLSPESQVIVINHA